MSKKLITKVGGVKIVADSHKEFIAKIKLALKCQHNHRIFKQEEFRLTRGESYGR